MAASTPRKAPVRKPAARKPAAPKAVPSNVLQLDRQEAVDAVAALVADREPLFSVGGVVYTIPKKVPTAWMIRAVELATTVSEAEAVNYALVQMLGEDGYTALAECQTLTIGDFETVRNAVLGKVIPKAPKAS
jgi:hypothetical protein